MAKFPEVFNGTITVTIKVAAATDGMGYYGKTLGEANRTRVGETTWKEAQEVLGKMIAEAKADVVNSIDHTEEIMRRNSETAAI